MNISNVEGVDKVAGTNDKKLYSSSNQKNNKNITGDDSFRFSIKFNLKKEHHRMAYERLKKIRKGEKSEFCINCILGKEDENQEIKNLIEATIKSCFEGVEISNISEEKAQGYDNNEVEIMDGVLDFMNGF